MDLSGISLRPKRSGTRLKISNPTLISGPKNTTTNFVSVNSPIIQRSTTNDSSTTLPLSITPAQSRSRDDKNTVADLVKRRYSTRFTNLDVNASAETIPNVPSLPNQFAGKPPPSRDGGASIRSNKFDANLQVAVKDPNFNAEDYVSRMLSNASELEIENFQRELRSLKNRADTDMQHNVFTNREQFIKISKEADKLRDELRILRSLMSDLTNTLGQITVTDGNMSSGISYGSDRSNRRTSVANLEALWNSHLQELWRRVEGSQKYLPAIPGRHVVYESGRWVELNSATWKPRRKVHLILLNDHLLVATEKKRPQDVPKDQKDPNASQLVALKCWPLQDVQIADLNMRVKPGTAEADASGNSINIRVGTESMTFATASKEIREKLALLSNFRKASEDLRRTLEAETQNNVTTRESIHGLGSPFLQSTFLDDSVSTGLSAKLDILVDVDGKPQSLRKVEGDIDDLDIKIALQSFDEAVNRIEVLKRVVKGVKNNKTAHTLLNSKLEDRTLKLVKVLLRYLADNNSWLLVTQQHVNWLIRLGYEDPAREAYLEARSQVINKRVRQVIFEGDLHQYIYQISFIYFNIIKHTASIFQACFPASVLSACVKWVKGHIDDFNALLDRQLSSVEEDSETYKACMERAMQHASMLTDVGLDFKDFIGKARINDK